MELKVGVVCEYTVAKMWGAWLFQKSISMGPELFLFFCLQYCNVYWCCWTMVCMKGRVLRSRRRLKVEICYTVWIMWRTDPHHQQHILLSIIQLQPSLVLKFLFCFFLLLDCHLMSCALCMSIEGFRGVVLQVLSRVMRIYTSIYMVRLGSYVEY